MGSASQGVARGLESLGGLFERRGVRVEVRDLVKIYRRGKLEVQALRGVSVSFEAGTITSIMGPSGSGKTTLLNMIGGVDRPTGGSVVFGGQRLEELGDEDLDRHRLLNVGFVFQAINLVPSLTARENVELPMILAGRPPGERGERALGLLRAVGLEGRADHYPEELSGGEQQRVAIAVALANDPPVIVADEPTAELDYETAKGVVDLLAGLARRVGKTVIVTTHDPRVAVRTDRIVRLEDGRVVGEYTPLELERQAAPAPGGAADAHHTLIELVRARIASLEREIEKLEEAARRGEVPLRQAARRIAELEAAIEALRDLLASIGG
ncbi:MAG: ABC transporter ATP-binding protein [Desulfurococcales archaeon]|nr:ABC transporter ATP-binding protein [Desulfurococcales archaeon]